MKFIVIFVRLFLMVTEVFLTFNSNLLFLRLLGAFKGVAPYYSQNEPI